MIVQYSIRTKHTRRIHSSGCAEACSLTIASKRCRRTSSFFLKSNFMYVRLLNCFSALPIRIFHIRKHVSVLKKLVYQRENYLSMCKTYVHGLTVMFGARFRLNTYSHSPPSSPPSLLMPIFSIIKHRGPPESNTMGMNAINGHVNWIFSVSVFATLLKLSLRICMYVCM